VFPAAGRCGSRRRSAIVSDGEAGASLSDVARLDTMVTVVDAANLLKDYASTDFLADRGESPGAGDQRSLVDLLVDQIEFADVILLNKIDVAAPAKAESARKIIRAKGHFWLATRPDWVGELSQASALVHSEAMGLWWAAVPKERWPDHPDWRAAIERNWDPVYGDRRQEIVFIGFEMDEAAIRSTLDACLVGDDDASSMPVEAWRRLPDPFPVWKRGQPEA